MWPVQGRQDLCLRTAEGMECWLSDGNGFSTRVEGPAWTDAKGWNAFPYWSTIRLVDITGDGKADLCARGSASLRCHPSVGDGFGDAIEVAPLSDAEGWDERARFLSIRTADIDGDGAQDICTRGAHGVVCDRWGGAAFVTVNGAAWTDEKGWNHPRYYRTIQLGDTTGDGKADICARCAKGWRCHASTGSGFDAPVEVDDFKDSGGWDKPKY